MKKLQHALNVIMGAFVGVCIGHGIYVAWEFQTYPERYALQSAPWYGSILLYGVFTLIVLVICMVLKVILHRCAKKSGDKPDKG